MDLGEVGVMQTGLIWLKIGTGGELLWIWCWTFRFHEMLGNYRVSKQLWISRVVLSSTELVSCRYVSTYMGPLRIGPNEHSSFYTTRILTLDDGHIGRNI
jgi:hypothetical protein